MALLNSLVDALEKELQQPDFDQASFRKLVTGVREKLSHFAAIENFLAPFEVHADSGEAAGDPAKFLQFISAYREYWEGSGEMITDHFLRYFDPSGMTLLTHSHSQTVFTLLQGLKARGVSFGVLQTVSAPGEEGRIACERMKQSGIPAELTGDDRIDEALERTGMVVTGCDALMPGEFLNKTGTRSILQKAWERKIPAVLVTESRKLIERAEWKHRVSAEPLFEWVPLEFVRRVVTEES